MTTGTFDLEVCFLLCGFATKTYHAEEAQDQGGDHGQLVGLEPDSAPHKSGRLKRNEILEAKFDVKSLSVAHLIPAVAYI